MPEEINRIITDNISQILFTPTKIAKQNIESEKISQGKVLNVGNTIVDVVAKYKKKLNNKILNKLNLKKNRFIILTLHRQETVDEQKRLELIINTIKNNKKLKDYKIVFPIHPRTKSKLKKNIFTKNFMTLQPLDYFSFLSLREAFLKERFFLIVLPINSIILLSNFSIKALNFAIGVYKNKIAFMIGFKTLDTTPNLSGCITIGKY